ncbi:MAG TPA: Imm74 family immunity protein [Candidatus Micrarchaeaceae archaeon]|nr:Imm74 family immunity protein [Candidatus Micrarchaeaceae archaeon]
MTEHFSMPKVDFVQSDAGYAVEVVSRTKVRYTEAARTMLIGAEPLLPAGRLALYISERQKWDPPHDDERLGSIEIARIVENIRAAFDYMGLTLVPDSG